jgi:hypothetical protein
MKNLFTWPPRGRWKRTGRWFTVVWTSPPRLRWVREPDGLYVRLAWLQFHTGRYHFD